MTSGSARSGASGASCATCSDRTSRSTSGGSDVRRHHLPPVHGHGLRTDGAGRGREHQDPEDAGRRARPALRRRGEEVGGNRPVRPPDRPRLQVAPGDYPKRQRTLPVSSSTRPYSASPQGSTLTTSDPERGGQACRRTCRPASTSRRSSRARARSKAWARRSPRSSASPSGPGQPADARQQLEPVHRHVRRLRAGLLPRPIRLRLLHERRRQRLRGAHRPERRRSRARPRKELAAGPHAQLGRLGSPRIEAGTPRRVRSASRSPTPAATTPPRHVQARRQAQRRAGRGVRPGHASAAARPTSRRWSTRSRESSGSRRSAASRRPSRRPARSRSPRPPPPRVPAPRQPDDYVGDVADRTGFGGLEAIDEVTMLCRAGPDERVPAGPDRPRGRPGRAAGDDRPLRADG